MTAQLPANGLDPIRVALREAGNGSPAIKIGVVDGVPDLEHPALRTAALDVLAAMIPPDAREPDAHATGICSIIFGAADAVRGLAPGCSGLALPIFFGRRAEARVRPASQLDLARAIAFALEQDVSIINVSAGQKVASPEADAHLEQALAHCAERRVLLVAAAGNDGCACLHLPAAASTALAVGALSSAGLPLEASNWAEPYQRNGLLAPGDGLPVAVPGGQFSTASGTSYATAVVSAVAALLLSVARRERYTIDPIDIQSILIDTAARCELPGDGACDRYLAGTLDAGAALAALHRAGTTSARPILIPNVLAASAAKELNLNQSLLRGERLMLESRSEQTDATIEQLGVSPSGCICEEAKEKDEKAVQQHGAPAPGIAPSAIEMRPLTPMSPPVARAGATDGLYQQACSCGGGQPPQIVYVLGALWFDFGSEARYDAIVQQMGGPQHANNPTELIAFLRANPHFNAGITFILMQDQIPVYAVQPAGPFAAQTYEAILDAIASSLDEVEGREQRVSLPGYVSGSTRLMNGMTVPVVFPDLRGMYKWKSAELIEATRSAAGDAGPQSDDRVLNFLNRVYYELRNLGIAPQERAMNYAATNAYQARHAFADSAARSMELDTIRVVKSPICRPDSDCWDVELAMFDPENERRANRIYRYTVDVSEVIPVTVGTVRSWSARS